MKLAPPPASWRRLGLHLLQYLLAFALIPNLPFWIAAPRLGIVTPGLLNLDTLALGLLALFVRPAWVLALFSLDLFLDIVYGIHATFGTNYIEIFLSFRYIFSVVSPAEMALVVGLVVLSIAAVALAWMYLRPRVHGLERRRLVAAVVFLMLPLAVAAHYQRAAATVTREAVWKRPEFVLPDSVRPSFADAAASTVRSPALALYHAWGRERVFAWMRGRSFRTIPIPSATDRAAALIFAAPSKPNLVLILVEAWGEANSARLDQSLMAPFLAPRLRRQYRVSSGLVAFQGSTAPGELRELCDRRLRDSSAPFAISPQDLAQCLPQRLDHDGYHTTVLDSVMQFWPGSANWYKLLGFQRQLGFAAFARQGMPSFTAGPFRSIADQNVAALLPGLLRAPTPQFIFMLTVSAHLPVHLPLPADYNAPCALAAVTRNDPQACGWYRIESKSLAAIASAASEASHTVFLVVGDHAPPLLGPAREAFSATQVPYVVLDPR